MSLSVINIAFLADDVKLVKDKTNKEPIFSLMKVEGDQWSVLNQWDDVGHVASLLVKFGYESDHLPAVELLSIL